MEHYFTIARVPKIDKLNITTMNLTRDANILWYTCNADNESVGVPRIW